MKHEGPNLFGRKSLVPKFLVSLVLSLSVAVAVAQTRTISIDLRNVSVKTFLAEVESRSNYTFAYNNAEIDLAAVVSIKAESEDIVAIVDRVLGPQRLKARIEGNRVILAPAANAGTAAARAEKSQKGVISGRVTTVAGDPVIGASVIVKETGSGNVTGLDGDYSIAAEPGQTLSFAFLGYNTREVKVGTRTVIDITLEEDNKQISEVVVVGYTPMRKSDFTGSIASVKASELSVPTDPRVSALTAAGATSPRYRPAGPSPTSPS